VYRFWCFSLKLPIHVAFWGVLTAYIPCMTSLIILAPKSTVLGRKHDVLGIQHKNQCNCWSFFDFPVDFCINALPVIQDGCCLPSWICYWKSWTTHEGPFTVSTPCKNFVMIDLVAFKLNMFYIFWLFMVDSPIQVPKNSV